MADEPLAEVPDVAGLWRPLTSDEATVAANKLIVASALLRHHLPTIDARVADGSLDGELVRWTVAEAVKRSMQGDPEGLRSRTDTRGPFTETRVYRDAAEFGIYFTPAELGTLGTGARASGTRVGSIRLRAGLAERTGGPHWWQSWTS